MVPLPTLRQLRYLDALAREKHFGRAAGACHVTQSTLSAGIRELETLLQAPLVDRSQRGAVLTPLGAEIVTRGRRVLREAEALVEAAAAGREPLSGVLRLGVIPTVAPFLLPRALPDLRRAYPRLRLYLKEDLTERLVEELEGGGLDLLLLALPCDCGDVETAALFEDRFRFACRSDDPAAAATTVAVETIGAERLLLLADGHCLREHALAACALAEPRQRPFQATSLHTLVQMVDNGLGVTLLPELAIGAGILDGCDIVVRPLAGERPGRTIGLAWRRGSARAAEFRLMADVLRRHAPRGASPSPGSPGSPADAPSRG